MILLEALDDGVMILLEATGPTIKQIQFKPIKTIENSTINEIKPISLQKRREEAARFLHPPDGGNVRH